MWLPIGFCPYSSFYLIHISSQVPRKDIETFIREDEICIYPSTDIWLLRQLQNLKLESNNYLSDKLGGLLMEEMMQNCCSWQKLIRQVILLISIVNHSADQRLRKWHHMHSNRNKLNILPILQSEVLTVTGDTKISIS